jgi:hypothetical protein
MKEGGALATSEVHMAQTSSYPPTSNKPEKPDPIAKWFSNLRTREGHDRVFWWAAILTGLAGVVAVFLAARQIDDFAEALQIQQTMAVIDEAHRTSVNLLRDDTLAEIIHSNSGTPEQRRRANLILAAYNSTLIKFALLQDRRIVDQKLAPLFRDDFCKLYQLKFFRGWWEDQKRTEPVSTISPSYRKLDATCAPL